MAAEHLEDLVVAFDALARFPALLSAVPRMGREYGRHLGDVARVAMPGALLGLQGGDGLSLQRKARDASR